MSQLTVETVLARRIVERTGRDASAFRARVAEETMHVSGAVATASYPLSGWQDLFATDLLAGFYDVRCLGAGIASGGTG